VRRLVSLHVSPWSERARWALDHHRLDYLKIQHVPFVGERRLRRLSGKKDRPTVPILLLDGETLTDSWDIALYADRVGQGSKLIPEDRRAQIRAFIDLADQTMSEARGLVTAAILASPAALDETLPATIPSFLRPLLRPSARYGSRWFARKYGVRLEETAAPLAKYRTTLLSLRESLAKSPSYLVGTFSYADIVMAGLLQGVSPAPDRYWRLGPATRKAWTQVDLASEFADLLAWRDRLYEMHRISAPGVS
jgi:glutathione S-transferase